MDYIRNNDPKVLNPNHALKSVQNKLTLYITNYTLLNNDKPTSLSAIMTHDSEWNGGYIFHDNVHILFYLQANFNVICKLISMLFSS